MVRLSASLFLCLVVSDLCSRCDAFLPCSGYSKLWSFLNPPPAPPAPPPPRAGGSSDLPPLRLSASGQSTDAAPGDVLFRKLQPLPQAPPSLQSSDLSLLLPELRRTEISEGGGLTTKKLIARVINGPVEKRKIDVSLLSIALIAICPIATSVSSRESPQAGSGHPFPPPPQKTHAPPPSEPPRLHASLDLVRARLFPLPAPDRLPGQARVAALPDLERGVQAPRIKEEGSGHPREWSHPARPPSGL